MGKGDRWVRRDRGQVNPLPQGERQLERAELGEHRIGREAAREIAKKVEDKGGFWGKRKDS